MPDTVQGFNTQYGFRKYDHGALANLPYGTPEMFGAVGDGTTDDTQAFVDALNSFDLVVGTPGKTYRVHDLVLDSKAIAYCLFDGVDKSKNAIILKSGALLYKNEFYRYNYCVTANTITVASKIISNTFAYSNEGCYFDVSDGDASLNSVTISDNYFVKMGTNVEDMNATFTEGTGRGIYLNGNWCGVYIDKNVFEYCSYCGVYLNNQNTSFRVGAFVENNYFEGNKNCAIYLNVISSTRNFIKITGNFYSVLKTNVFNTNYINFVSAYSYYVIEDIVRISGQSEYMDNDHKHVINNSVVTDIYWMITATRPVNGFHTIRCTLENSSGNSLEIRDSSYTNVLATVVPGNNVITLPTLGALTFNRKLADGETLTIYDID